MDGRARTAGTWMYHDHAMGNAMIGAEDKGLFGTLVVNPASGKVPALIDGKVVDVDIADIKREFILWMHETTFWGQELNHIVKGDKEIPLWTNPTVGRGSARRSGFISLGIGTAFHTFHLHGHRWLEPGTTSVIDTINIGRLALHCHVIQHMQSGMMGTFRVIERIAHENKDAGDESQILSHDRHGRHCARALSPRGKRPLTLQIGPTRGRHHQPAGGPARGHPRDD